MSLSHRLWQQLSAQQRMYQMQLQNHNRQLQAGHPNMIGRSVPVLDR
jgi:hypothetical protein